MGPGGCFKDLYKAYCDKCAELDRATSVRVRELNIIGEKEMNEMTIKEFKALVVANDDAVEGKLYRAVGITDNPDPQASCVKRGAHVFVLRCIKVTKPPVQEPPYVKPYVQMGLEEFVLIADDCVAGPPEDRQPVTDESEDCPSLIGERIYWARNRVAMKSIKQALIAFLFEADSPENRQTIARICTVRIQEDYPDCNMVLEHTPEDILNKKYHFILTEGSRVVHYGADFITANDAIYAGLGKKATRDVRVDITGEENSG